MKKMLFLALSLLLCIRIAYAESEKIETIHNGEIWGYTVIDHDAVEITAYYGSKPDLVIPAQLDGMNVVSIGVGAFDGHYSLVSVDIPDSIVTIKTDAFARCGNLRQVTFSNHLKEIGAYAFYGCSQLLDFSLPQSVVEVSDCAFAWCSSLTNFALPNTVLVTGENIFQGCANLIDPFENSHASESFSYLYGISDSASRRPVIDICIEYRDENTRNQWGEQLEITGIDEEGNPVWTFLPKALSHTSQWRPMWSTIKGDRIYGCGADGYLFALDFATGNLLWSLQLDIFRDENGIRVIFDEYDRMFIAGNFHVLAVVDKNGELLLYKSFAKYYTDHLSINELSGIYDVGDQIAVSGLCNGFQPAIILLDKQTLRVSEYILSGKYNRFPANIQQDGGNLKFEITNYADHCNEFYLINPTSGKLSLIGVELRQTTPDLRNSNSVLYRSYRIQPESVVTFSSKNSTPVYRIELHCLNDYASASYQFLSSEFHTVSEPFGIVYGIDQNEQIQWIYYTERISFNRLMPSDIHRGKVYEIGRYQNQYLLYDNYVLKALDCTTGALLWSTDKYIGEDPAAEIKADGTLLLHFLDRSTTYRLNLNELDQ